MIEHDTWPKSEKEEHAIIEAQRMAWYERKYIPGSMEPWHDYAARFERWLIRYLDQEAI
jgi:hypothetical protein